MSLEHSPLPEDARKRIVALMAAHGASQAARFLKISPQTFDRAIGGLNLHPWTLLSLEKAIEERDAAGKVP